MKHIRLLPSQIPDHWNLIKFAAEKVAAVETEYRKQYLNKLLNDLLSSKAQCYFRLHEKEVMAILITRRADDIYRDIKVLLIDILYSFKPAPEEDWQELINMIVEYAKGSECNLVAAYSGIPRVWEICKGIGFKESFRCFVIDC